MFSCTGHVLLGRLAVIIFPPIDDLVVVEVVRYIYYSKSRFELYFEPGLFKLKKGLKPLVFHGRKFNFVHGVVLCDGRSDNYRDDK